MSLLLLSKKPIVENGRANPDLDLLSDQVRNHIESLNRTEIAFVMQKILSDSDLNKNQNCLSFNTNKPCLEITRNVELYKHSKNDGSLIGEMEEIDEGASEDCDGKLLKVRVVINVDKPLQWILRVDAFGDGGEYVILLRYERLPDHCHRCRRLGHRPIKCTNTEATHELLFGAWLKAGTPICRPTKPENTLSLRLISSQNRESRGGRKEIIGINQLGPSLGSDECEQVDESFGFL
ncbi:hypothetical protein Q3G72_007831 [Acer saccharum]|nr:hypothetical protein Q3G72_007831 [Acer saccharum]